MKPSREHDTMKRLKVLFLYNRPRQDYFDAVKRGEGHSAAFWGLIHLPDNGIHADFLELEQYIPKRIATFLRRHIIRSIYFIHTPLLLTFFRYDIVFSSAAFGSQLLLTLWPFRKPLWVMHDFSITSMIGNASTVRQRLFRFLVRRSAGIVTVGKEEKEKLRVLFPELKNRIEYIPFGVDLDFFAPQDVPEDGTVLAVGFDPDRDWRTLIEAVRGTSLQVVIATRPDRLRGLTLPENVTQRMYTQRELIDAYARASVIAIPMDTSTGVNDAMGCTTLFEAMAMQKPIVATRTHTFLSYVTSGENGILVPEGDASALRASLQSVLQDAELRQRLGERARAYAVEHLDVHVLTKKLALFFEHIASQGRNRKSYG